MSAITDHAQLLKSLLEALGEPEGWPISDNGRATYMSATVPMALLNRARASVGMPAIADTSPDFSGRGSQSVRVSGGAVVVQTEGNNRVIVNGVDVTPKRKKGKQP